VGDRVARRQRTPRSRERILQAAVIMADAEGIDSLTMPGLASELQVEAMSLYNHVDNEGDLLDEMIEFVAAGIEEPDEDAMLRERREAGFPPGLLDGPERARGAV
jgi:AcrR family transcriptional regulator